MAVLRLSSRIERIKRLPVSRPRCGVQRVIAEELEQAAVRLAGAWLQDDVEDSSLRIAEFRRGIASDDANFFDGIRCGLIGHQILGRLIVVDAIQQEIVRLRPVAVDKRTPSARRSLSGWEWKGVGGHDARERER